MKTWSQKALARHKAQKIGLAVAALVASMRVGAAQEQYEQPQHGFYQNHPSCTSLDDCYRRVFDNSGTPGRMGLGADPAHPEGPGNVLD
ncbi:MAG: hypothetical protein WBW81_10705 [Methylocella sp.]